VHTGNTGASTRVASSASSVQLAAEQRDRTDLLIHNNSTATLYVKYGTAASITASSESYTAKVAPDGTFAMGPCSAYTGVVHGIWSAANGFAMVTQVLP
jgi:hypothetical protein